MHGLRADAAMDACRTETWAVSARHNVVQEVAWIPQAHSIDKVERAHSLLARVRAVPTLVDQEITLLRSGLAEGRFRDLLRDELLPEARSDEQPGLAGMAGGSVC